jgi:hypothetical protein
MWRRLGHTVAVAAARAAVCVSIALGAAGAAGAEGVAARIVEVGDGGRIAAGDPATVRVEISTGARLSGTFRARLARPREGRPDREMYGMPSAGVRFLLEAGETRVLNAYLPDVPEDSCSGVQLQWSVDDEDGRRLSEGVQSVVCIPSLSTRVRVLYLTGEALPSRRAPAAAYDEAQSYSGYSACFVSGRDFARLREEQREALLDWAALGSVLVLTTPLAPPGQGIDSLLASPRALLWRDASGREVREARLHLGFVRTIDLPLPSVAGAAGSALYRLVTSDDPVAPGPDDRAFRSQPLAGPWDEITPSEEPGRVGRAIGAAALLLFLVVAGGLRWSSRPRVAAPAVVITVFAALLAVAPALVYVATSSVPTGNANECWDLVLHDAAGGLQSRWTRASLGGGGGRVDPVLSFMADPRVAWRAWRHADSDSSLRTELDTDGRVRVGTGRRALSSDRLLVVRRAEAGPNRPAWDCEGVATREGGLTGSLRSRRAFARMGVVGPLGAAWLGSVRQGERIDLSRLSWPPARTLPSGTGDRLERVALHLLLKGRFFDGRSPRSPLPAARPAATYTGGRRPEEAASAVVGALLESLLQGTSEDDLVHASPLYAIATEAAPCSVAVSSGGVDGPPCTVHVQPLLTEDPVEPAGSLPAERRAEMLHVHVPALLWDRMSAEGRALRPEVGYLEASPPAVSPSAVDGFREVVFRVGGAPTSDRPGGRGMVLGRWRPRTSQPRQP